MNATQTIYAVLRELWQFVLDGFVYRPETPGGEYNAVVLEDSSYYGPENPHTNHLRLLLTKTYSEIEILRPLQPSEYVLFALLEDGHNVLLDARRWAPGTWHQKLKGEPGLHISVTPMQGSVMEYFDEEQEGVIGYVKEVTDEEAIVFASIGLYQPGVFEVHKIPREVWHELRPVFISFNKK